MKLEKENSIKEIKHLDVFFLFLCLVNRDRRNSYSQQYFLSAFCFVHALIISLHIVLSRIFSVSHIQCGDLLSITYTNNCLEINSYSTTDFYSQFSCLLQQANKQNSSQDGGIHRSLTTRKSHLQTIISQAQGGLTEKKRLKTLAMQKQIEDLTARFYNKEIDGIELLNELSILVASKK